MIGAEEWNRIVTSFSGAHVLQTWQWGLVKQRFGWEMLPKIWKEDGEIYAAALVLKRRIRLPLLGSLGSIHYVPKGPLIRSWKDGSMVERVLGNLETLAKEQKAILIKIDPDVEFAHGEAEFDWISEQGRRKSLEPKETCGADDLLVGKWVVSLLIKRGWVFSREQVQFRNTVKLDLRLSEEELLARMKQKTRYNIRLAERKGVKVREGGVVDIPTLYRMYQETSRRDGFLIREEAYYAAVWQIFQEASRFPTEQTGGCMQVSPPFIEPFAKILIAEVEDEPIAGLVLLIFRDKAWYMYGMSTDRHREKMPNYLLHWRAIQFLHQIGVREYDLWGAPDRFEESDPMYGVYRFKRGFGAEPIQHIGAWDFAVSKIKYRLYQEVLPRYLRLLRLQKGG